MIDYKEEVLKASIIILIEKVLVIILLLEMV